MPAMRTRAKRMATRGTVIRRMTMAVITITTMIVTTTTVKITAIITMTSIAIMTINTAIPMLMAANKPPRRPRRAMPDAEVPRQDVPAASLSAMSEGEAAAQYRLMTWLSPSFPVGAFSYSSGIEWAVEAGDIGDAASLKGWLASMLADGAGFCDGVFVAQTHRAASSGDEVMLVDIAELASAFAPSRERLLETSAQGRAFVEIARAAWNCVSLDRLIACSGGVIVYPVAVGLVSAAHAISLEPTLHAFLHAVTSNWVSAGARLVPLGQTDSQRVLAQLEPVVAATASRALAASLDDLGSATFRADLASMRHEAQYTRLFRS
jgi:urease accessory protein